MLKKKIVELVNLIRKKKPKQMLKLSMAIQTTPLLALI